MIVDIHAHLGHHPIQDFKQELEEILDVMDRFGIDKSFLLPFPSMKMRKVNDAVAKAVKQYPDRLVGFACIDPASEDALDEVNRAVSIGLRGIMLDPEFHRVFGRGPSNVEELMVPCFEHDLPVLFNTPNIETGESSMMGREPYYTGLNQLAFKFPEVRLVVNIFWPKIRELIGGYSNIIIDTGGRNGIQEGLLPLVPDIGPTRICFGSESPQNHPAIGIQSIRTIKVAPVYRELLLGRNAERIFKDII